MAKAAKFTLPDDDESAYPASENTPGQKQSRKARRAFLDMGEACPWLEDYFQLRQEGWDWRKAAYIAWASSPVKTRWPKNQQDLAKDVLGLRSDRTIRTWREKDSTIDERVARLQIEPLMRYRRDINDALIASCQLPGKEGAPDRRMYYTMTGDLKPGKVTDKDDREGGHTPSPYENLSRDELTQVIKNLELAVAKIGEDDEEPGDEE